MDTAPIANLYGFLALISYIITLMPTILRIVFPQTRKTNILKLLFKYRRHIGLIAFVFALVHGFLFIKQRNFDFFDWQTYFNYNQGVATLLIFTLLAITSNNWSIKKLKHKNWKKLHSLTYLAMFLLTWHVLEKMSSHWSFFTPISLLGLIAIILLFIWRKKLENQPKSTLKNSIKKT